MAARLREELIAHEAESLFYDAGIVVTEPPKGAWDTESVLFGGTVKGPQNYYTEDLTNRDRFAYRNSQLAFALKHRAEATRERFERGNKSIPEEACLFLPADTPDDVLMELSQPTWLEDPRSRVRIEKAHEGEDSPNRYDALALAFAEDSAYGLEHYVREPAGEPTRLRR